MAKRIVDEDIRFNVIINGDKGQKELYDLEKRNRSLKESTTALRKEKALLEAQGKKNTQEYKSLTQKINANNKEVKENAARMKVLQQQIGVTGLTLRQLGQRASQLRLQLANMLPNDPRRAQFRKELEAINRQMLKLKGNAATAESSLSKWANGFNKYAALGTAALAVLTGWVVSAQKIIDVNGKLADSQSDVMKTTGMSKQEVDELTKSFGLLETRTSRINLLKIAEEGGRIGIVKEEIADFVDVMNKATVALGDSFPGGAEEVASKLGKLKFLFKETKDLNVDTAFNAIGSSINELGASGNATEINIAEFTTRLGGLPDALKPAIGDVLGLGAAFEESGISAEISARAYGIIMQNATTNTEKFAKVMGVSNQEVKDLLNENPLEFFLQFSQGLQGMDATQIGETLKFLGVSATGATKAIGAAANNQERFRELLTISNQALVDGTSLTEEYAIKNNNLAATIDKIKKSVLGAFTSDDVVNGLSNFVEWFAKFIGASEDVDGRVTRFRNTLVTLLKVILVVTAAIVSYNTAVKLAAILTGGLDKTSRLYILTQKIATASTTALRAATLLYSATINLVTGNIKRARAAMILFNQTVKLNPIGLVLSVIAAAVTAFYLFSKASKEAATSQSLLNNAMQEADKQTAKTIKEKQLLLSVARDENLSLKQRKEAVDELNRIVPEYNNQLTIETANTLEAKGALDKHIESLKQSAIAHALQEKIKEKAVELSEIENSSIEDNIKWYNTLWNTIKTGGQPYAALNANMMTGIKNRMESVNATKEEIKILEELYKAQLKNNPDESPTGGPSEGDEKTINGRTFVYRNGQWVLKNPYRPPGPGSSDKVSEAQKEAEALLKLQRETEDARIAQIQDAFAREMAQNDVNHTRKVQDLELKAAQALEAFDKAVEKGDTDIAAIYLDQYNEALNQIEVLETTHQQNRNKILEDGISAHIQSLEQAYKREEEQRLVEHNKALAALGNNEEAKKQLQEQYDREKLERQKANQQLLINELQSILSNAQFEDFSIELLSDEQLQTIKDRLSQLGLSISEINVLLAHMKGKSTDEFDFVAGGNVDVLGFTQEDWERIFSNTERLTDVIGKVGNVVTAAAQAYALYDQFAKASEQKRLQKLERETQKGIDEQDRLLKNKLISQKQHDDAVAALEDKLEKEKLETEYKQAKRQKAMNIANILGNQAVAVSKALAQGGFVLGIPWAGIVAALAGIQLGLAVAQPLPAKGYEKGFYNNMPVRREQDGKLFNASFGGESRSGLVDKPTVFLAGEGGKNFPELIINGNDLKQLDPTLTKTLYSELARIKGFENGYYPRPESAPDAPNDELKPLMLAALIKNNELLEALNENGVIAYMSKDLDQIKKFRDELDRLQKIERKSVIVK